MITNKEYTLRKGQKRDKPARNWVSTVTGRQGEVIHENTPDYVLIYENQQVGALHGDIGHIFHIEIFEEFRERGHGKKFVELLEQEAKNLGIRSIEAYPVTNPVFAHILEIRRALPKDTTR